MPEVNTNFFPIMVRAVNEAAAGDMDTVNAFVRRTRDGKFYRGARWWRWCKSWRRAAVFRVYFWRNYVFPFIPLDEDVEFVFLDQLES